MTRLPFIFFHLYDKKSIILSFYLFTLLLMSRLEKVLPFFELVAGTLLSDREIVYILKGLRKRIVNCFGEIAYNLCVIASAPLTVDEKRYLRKFQNVLFYISCRKHSLHQRREKLICHPKLVRVLGSLAMKYV